MAGGQICILYVPQFGSAFYDRWVGMEVEKQRQDRLYGCKNVDICKLHLWERQGEEIR